MANLLSHSVVRLAGLPFQTLAGLADREVFRRAGAHREREDALRTEAGRLSERLGALVPERTKRDRRRLLRLRRDLFNLRDPRPSDVDVIGDHDLEGGVWALAAEVAALRTEVAHFDAAFGEATVRARAHLLDLARDVDFRAALRLSSRSLFRELRRVETRSGRALDSKAERGLLRYLTRASAKATPFARFCAVVPGRIEPADAPIQLIGDPAEKWGRIRINKRLMQVLLQRLFTDEAARRQLPLRLNPTVERGPEAIRYLAASEATEAFQTVARNPALDLVFDRLRTTSAGTVVDLASGIVELDEVEATPDEAETYLDRLLDIGLLQPDLPGLGHDPQWTDRLREIVHGIEGSEVADEISSFLRSVASQEIELTARGIDPDSADAPLESLTETISSTMREWLGDAGRPLSPVAFEDASAKCRVLVDRDHFSEAFTRLGELLDTLSAISWARGEALTIRAFFERRFGGDRAPLLEFYEAYHREHVKPLQEAQRERRRGDVGDEPAADGSEADEGTGEGTDEAPAHLDPSKLPEIRALRAAYELARDRAVELWREAAPEEEVSLCAADLAPAVAQAPPVPPGPRSIDAFVTLVPRPGAPAGGRLVLPNAQAFTGFGKYFSRFLYLLPDEVHEAIGCASDVPAGATLAEIAGDQAFNANLRPPICEAEIAYPTGARIGCPRHVDVTELDVGLSEAGDQVEVTDLTTGQRVLPLDLGFLNIRSRPPLYRLLRFLGPTSSTFFGLPWRLPDPPEGERPHEGLSDRDAPRVTHRPRIVYEDAVVIAREAWVADPGSIPQRGHGETDAAFYLRLVEWQGRAGVPERCYVRAVVDREKQRKARAEAKAEAAASQAEGEGGADAKSEPEKTEVRRNGARGGRPASVPGGTDLRKPQFIDFASPLLPTLLEAYTTLVGPRLVIFEECLPDQHELPVDSEGRSWVAEAIVQLDFALDSSVPVEAELAEVARG